MATEKQTAAVKYLIFNARKDNRLARQILTFLLNKSEGLTREVCITLQADEEKLTEEELHDAAHAIDWMNSCNGTVHLNEVMAATGADLHFSLHYGHYDAPGIFNTKGQFPGDPGHPNHIGNEPLRFTFWLAKGSYGHGFMAETTRVTKEELVSIDIQCSGLYKHEP